MRVSEIRVNQIRVNQGLGVLTKSPGIPKSFQEAPRKLQKISEHNSRNILVGILDETDFS